MSDASIPAHGKNDKRFDDARKRAKGYGAALAGGGNNARIAFGKDLTNLAYEKVIDLKPKKHDSVYDDTAVLYMDFVETNSRKDAHDHVSPTQQASKFRRWTKLGLSDKVDGPAELNRFGEKRAEMAQNKQLKLRDAWNAYDQFIGRMIDKGCLGPLSDNEIYDLNLKQERASPTEIEAVKRVAKAADSLIDGTNPAKVKIQHPKIIAAAEALFDAVKAMESSDEEEDLQQAAA